MPKSKASTLSALVTLLMERFLPDAQQRYVLPNLQASEWYRKYNDFVPEYLRGRPRSVILHCLNRKLRSSDYAREDLSMKTTEGVFVIKKKDGNQHLVSFGRDSLDLLPSCSCKDWIRWHLPCKHFFTIFRLMEGWGWNSLPQKYLQSAYLSTDQDATDLYFSQFSSDQPSDAIDSGQEVSNINLPRAEDVKQPIPVKVRM